MIYNLLFDLVAEANLIFHIWAEGFAQTNLKFSYFATYGAALALCKNFIYKTYYAIIKGVVARNTFKLEHCELHFFPV